MSRVSELSDFFELLPVPLYRSAPDGTLLAGNRALANVLGFDTMEELLEETTSVANLWVNPGERQRWVLAFESHRTIRDFDVQLERSDGTTIWVHDTARAVMDDKGEILHFEGCLFDVTDRIRLERSRDQFIATVSHELRNPIAAIFGLSAELDSNLDQFDEAEKTEMISLIAREAEEASWLIEDLLVAHREDLQGVAVNPVSFSISDEISRICEGIPTTVDVLDPGRATVRADPLRTRQILRNLLTNAVKYGGPEIRVIVSQENREVAVEVCDTGNAIEPETLQRIFEPFASSQSHPGSVGLGLWISKRLAELMGGTITYRYRSGESCFQLTLPAE